ncbi:hypothetical protein Lser_V15G34134 [Lactuca serriola]
MRQVKVHHALLTWQLKLYHLHGSILLRVLHEAAIGVGGFVRGQGPLPVGGFRFEEEGFHHHSLAEVVVEVVAATIRYKSVVRIMNLRLQNLEILFDRRWKEKRRTILAFKCSYSWLVIFKAVAYTSRLKIYWQTYKIE